MLAGRSCAQSTHIEFGDVLLFLWFGEIVVLLLEVPKVALLSVENLKSGDVDEAVLELVNVERRQILKKRRQISDRIAQLENRRSWRRRNGSDVD